MSLFSPNSVVRTKHWGFFLAARPILRARAQRQVELMRKLSLYVDINPLYTFAVRQADSRRRMDGLASARKVAAFY